MDSARFRGRVDPGLDHEGAIDVVEKRGMSGLRLRRVCGISCWLKREACPRSVPNFLHSRWSGGREGGPAVGSAAEALGRVGSFGWRLP